MLPLMDRGIFITLEGVDGSGKTTQLNLLSEWLVQNGISPVMTRQPGGTETGERIRSIVLNSQTSPLAPNAELALMFADRAQSIQEIILPSIKERRVILCDRYTDSTEAYQGGGRQVSLELISSLHRLLCNNLQPDLTILLLPSFERSLARARSRNQQTIAASGPDEDRFEREQDDFHRRVFEQYRAIAAREPNRVLAIEGDHTIEEVHSRIIAAVQPLVAHLIG